VNTVSPTHAKEMQSGEFGCGLEGVLRNRNDRFSGIINGVDYKLWNPQGDPHIFKNYSGDSLQDKRVNKSKLQEVCGLARSLTRPLLGFVGRLVEQKGIDLIVSILPQLCHQGFQTVILGTGEKKYEEALTRMAQENPSLVYFGSRFDDELAHRIYAGSDLFLMPSRFEPCGIGQMISFKYGTVPVAYKTGGLADTVVDYSFKDKSGSGFLLAKYDAKGLLTAIQKGAKVFADTESWQELMKHIMRLNFPWKESAKKYVALYEKAKHLS
jgi:starch synthase